MSKLMDRLKARSTIKEASLLNQSLVFDQVEPVMTSVPAINIALGGSLDGGLLPGMIQVTGPSKHFKSNMSLLMVSAYMKKYPESVCLFYDSEFGSKDSYFEAFGIDAGRVLHVPITNLEQLKFDLVQQLDEFKKGDRVVIYIDSIGNLASKKEAEDALSGNQATDMSRAKFIKGLWRIVTPHLTLKQIPLIAINHVYATQEIYSKNIVSGGTGNMLSSDNVWIISRQQVKGNDGLEGWNFVINIEKSRLVQEKSKIPLTVKFDSGIDRYSGLLDMALLAGSVVKPSNGWFSKVDPETGEISPKKYRRADTDTEDFWADILSSDKFKKWVETTYKLSNGQMLSDASIDSEIESSKDD